jgi:telomerase reverse transcriptase
VIQLGPASLTDYATPAASVSAFCRAVIQKLIPRQFFGIGPDGVSNFKMVLRHVDRFIKLRRFESSSLHEVCKGVKVRDCLHQFDRLRQKPHTDPLAR